MAKISLNKLITIRKVEPVTITINEQEVVIAQYLPMEEKAKFTEEILNRVVDETGFFNPARLETYFNIMIVKYYTNISITDKMLDEASKTYDLLEMNDIFAEVIHNIPEGEYEMLFETVEESAKHAVEYLNSFVGMLRTISADYSATKMNVDEILNTLGDPNQIGLVKDILDKIG